jgi:hypothetical protein
MPDSNTQTDSRSLSGQLSVDRAELGVAQTQPEADPSCVCSRKRLRTLPGTVSGQLTQEGADLANPVTRRVRGFRPRASVVKG